MRDINNYTNLYIDSPFVKYQVSYRRKKVLEIIKKYKHNSILEIGCGLEPLFNFIEDYDSYTIVEPSDFFFENALKKADTRVKCVHAYLEEADELLEREYDFIICSSLLHEVEDSNRILAKMRQLSSDNTVLHINVPNAFSIHRLLALESGLIENLYEESKRQKELQQSSIYDLNSLKRQVEECQFQVIEEGSYFIKPFTHKQMQLCIDYGILNDSIIEGFDNLIKYFPNNGSEIFVNMKIH